MLFPSTGNNSFVLGSAPLNAVPVFFHARIQLINPSDGLAHGAVCVSQGSGGGANADFFYLYVTSGVVSFQTRTSGGAVSIATAGTISDAEPHSIVGYSSADNSRQCGLDGVLGSVDTGNLTPTAGNFNQAGVGCLVGQNGIPASLFDMNNHRILDAAGWNAIPSQADVIDLFRGKPARKILPANLLFSVEAKSHSWDPVQSKSWTVSGPIFDGVVPRVMRRRRSDLLVV
jgi:hypothetical protein